MSMFSIPEELMLDTKNWEKMNRDLSALLPSELSGAVNLMAHPMAGAMAFSALGVGFASHAFGVWMGTVSGAAEMTQRMLTPVFDELADDAGSFADKPPSPTARAQAAAKVLIADTQEAAEAAIDTAAEMPAPAGAVADLLPEDFRQPKSMDKPETPDDLKTISGIGAKIETVLNGLGIWTYAQIAAWSREEVAWVDDYLSFTGRIGRDNWIEQAAALAKIDTKH
jgi:NADH-quinone oxidoreductase subunit E